MTIHAVPILYDDRKGEAVVGGSGRRHAIRNPRSFRRRSSFWVDSRTGGARQGRSSGAVRCVVRPGRVRCVTGARMARPFRFRGGRPTKASKVKASPPGDC
jgi:hypothetical protein